MKTKQSQQRKNHAKVKPSVPLPPSGAVELEKKVQGKAATIMISMSEEYLRTLDSYASHWQSSRSGVIRTALSALFGDISLQQNVVQFNEDLIDLRRRLTQLEKDWPF